MLGNSLIVEVARLSMASSFVQLNDSIVEIEDHELITREVG